MFISNVPTCFELNKDIPFDCTSLPVLVSATAELSMPNSILISWLLKSMSHLFFHIVLNHPWIKDKLTNLVYSLWKYLPFISLNISTRVRTSRTGLGTSSSLGTCHANLPKHLVPGCEWGSPTFHRLFQQRSYISKRFHHE